MKFESNIDLSNWEFGLDDFKEKISEHLVGALSREVVSIAENLVADRIQNTIAQEASSMSFVDVLTGGIKVDLFDGDICIMLSWDDLCNVCVDHNAESAAEAIAGLERVIQAIRDKADSE